MFCFSNTWPSLAISLYGLFKKPQNHPAAALPRPETPGGQIADRHFIRWRVLDDLTAEVGAVDGPQVLLIGLAIGMVLAWKKYGVRTEKMCKFQVNR